MKEIVYTLDGVPYLNITNKCPCDCVFCLRKSFDAVGTANNLWHHGDPTLDEIKAAIDAFDFSKYSQVVFCGYGEPTCAYDNLIAAARYIKSKYDIEIRLNTNGLSDLINKKKTAAELANYIDAVSISLNGPDSKRYLAVTRPAFGEGSFEAMLEFAAQCKKLMKSVKFTVVDVITPEEIAACQKIADTMGIPLRVRTLIK